MCGLTGFWSAATAANDADTSGSAEQLGLKMAAAIHHRGPDDSGVWFDPAGICLAHRRLSILDLSPQGHQPMHSATGRFTIVFNGEIYNFGDLRRELEQASGQIAWRGHSDTEVLLAAFEAWGIGETLKRLIGMFAIALWDRQDKCLYLARDRAGEKPLYYGWQRGTFLFGSELAALTQHPSFEKVIDQNALGLLMKFAYVPTPYSIYSGISKLAPGTLLRMPLSALRQGAQPEPEPYWSWVSAAGDGMRNPLGLSPEAATDALESLLMDAIGKQMVADVPLGAFLSGGIDSSTIVALMQKQSSRPVKTFTIGFNEAAYNEAEHAAEVARHLGTEHTELYVTDRDALALIPELPGIYSEPFADSSQIPTTLVSRLARQHVTVSLSGDAGDELFAGYNRYLTADRLWRKLAPWPVAARRAFATIINALPPSAWDKAFAILQPALGSRFHFNFIGDKLHKLAAAMPAPTSHQLYDGIASFWRPEVVMRNHAPTDRSHWPPPNTMPGFTDWMMVQDGMTYLPDDILVKVDRAAMSASLETRVPFLDHRVIEFAARLPMDYRIRDGKSKWLLREVLYRHVPREMIERPKMGFGVPIDRWLRGPLRDWAESLLTPQKLEEHGFFNSDRIRQAWAEHLSGRRNAQHHLWPVLMFGAWREATA